MNDLIDELALIAWNSEPKNATTIVKAVALLKKQESIIESLKSDLSETLDIVSNRKNVTKCKECKMYLGNGWCNRSGIHLEVNDDWFCADGERKEG